MIACNNAYYLVQVKHEKKMEAQIWVKWAKIRLKNLFFFFFFFPFSQVWFINFPLYSTG